MTLRKWIVPAALAVNLIAATPATTDSRLVDAVKNADKAAIDRKSVV